MDSWDWGRGHWKKFFVFRSFASRIRLSRINSVNVRFGGTLWLWMYMRPIYVHMKKVTCSLIHTNMAWSPSDIPQSCPTCQIFLVIETGLNQHPFPIGVYAFWTLDTCRFQQNACDPGRYLHCTVWTCGYYHIPWQRDPCRHNARIGEINQTNQ